MIRHLIVCLVLLLLLHGAAGAELTLEDMDAEGGIPALVATYFRAFNAADEAGLRMFLGNHRDATSLARTPLDQRVERQLQFREMFGEIVPVQVRTQTDRNYEIVVYASAVDGYFLASFEATEFDPIRFGSVGMRPADAPGEERPSLSGRLPEVVAMVRENRGLPALGVAIVGAGGIGHVAVDGFREAGGTVRVEPDDLFHYGSITKSVTSCIAARLVDRGLISYETTLEDGLDGVWLHSGFRAVTLEQLLQHRAGVEPLTKDDPEREKKWAAAGDDPRAQRRALAADVLSVAPASAPGTTMSYSNAGYAVVALMLEQASGTNWEEMVVAEVSGPLGLSSWGIGWPATPERPKQPRGHYPGPVLQAMEGYALGSWIDPAGDLHGTALDLARYGHALATAPEGWIRPETIARMLTAAGDRPDVGYAMGLMREEMAPRSIALHNGSAGTFFAMVAFDPATGDAVAVVMNEGNLSNDAVARAIVAAVFDGSVTP